MSGVQCYPLSDPTPRERLQDELTAIESIHPGEVEWMEKNREFVYKSIDGRSSFVLRLPDRYLIDELPEVITANASKTDLRDHLQSILKDRDPTVEMLDVMLEEFIGVSQSTSTDQTVPDEVYKSEFRSDVEPSAEITIAVWLHHLLNLNKRKQAITPASAEVSGWSKPGYPGILLFTGPAAAVQAHVKELKGLRWQAFQVRLEVDEAWPVPHKGMVEAESLSDIVSGLEPAHRDIFSSAILRF